jgi:hypothetical protein
MEGPARSRKVSAEQPQPFSRVSVPELDLHRSHLVDADEAIGPGWVMSTIEYYNSACQ